MGMGWGQAAPATGAISAIPAFHPIAVPAIDLQTQGLPAEISVLAAGLRGQRRVCAQPERKLIAQ
jgi:hypothetical protein